MLTYYHSFYKVASETIYDKKEGEVEEMERG